MKKQLLIFLALLMLLFTGCGEKQTVQTQPESKPQAEENTNTIDTPEKDDLPTEEQTPQTDETDIITAEWVSQAPEGVSRVNVDENGELILLTAEQTLNHIWICRVEYREQSKDFERTEKLWWMNEWEKGTQLLIQMKLPHDQPELEISWEDEFSERERRLIVPSRIMLEGEKIEQVLLVHYAVPLSPTELTDKTPYHYDLDRDAEKETVEFIAPNRDDGAQAAAILRIKKDNVQYEQKMAIFKDASCRIADLDEDGEAEIYVSGDAAEDDFVTYGWKLGETGICAVEMEQSLLSPDANGAACFAGGIEKIEDGIMFMKRNLHLFGHSYLGHAYYAVTKGQLEPLDGYWTLDEGDLLTLSRPLAATLENGTETTLKKGSRLTLAGTDLESFMKLKTEDGLQITLDMKVSKNGEWRIDDTPAENIFE